MLHARQVLSESKDAPDDVSPTSEGQALHCFLRRHREAGVQRLLHYVRPTVHERKHVLCEQRAIRPRERVFDATTSYTPVVDDDARVLRRWIDLMARARGRGLPIQT